MKNADIIVAETAVITDMEALCHNSIDLIRYARGLAVQHVNIIELMTNYALGRWIIYYLELAPCRCQSPGPDLVAIPGCPAISPGNSRQIAA